MCDRRHLGSRGWALRRLGNRWFLWGRMGAASRKSWCLPRSAAGVRSRRDILHSHGRARGLFGCGGLEARDSSIDLTFQLDPSCRATLGSERHCKGHVYQDVSPPGDIVFPMFHPTSPATDRKIREYLRSQLGKERTWDALGGENCRHFSQAMFRHLLSTYGAPSQPPVVKNPPSPRR